ncbi:hypothetical protein F3Y22_tig00111402pilonHSYRG00124 [Hibiscus syriacus]|uniref:Pre-mRNA polyadenylation factor Fip1 domain-containing protein n=1 Tax=Hibiscus syriacus TaxID=106335 RepID=A0A6A2Y457_HIBSY|nr:hypothetical protein F3Y22_tig00111402pilonHSYRG00124 [Hibiscus syriacus]
MEEDDEFGDLYSDVLMPFSSTSTTTSSSASVAPQPHQPSPAPTLRHLPIDLNHQSQILPSFKSLPPLAVPAGAAPDSIPSTDSAHESKVLDSKQGPEHEKEVVFDIEKGLGNGIEDIGSNDPLIPGLTEAVRQEDNDNRIQGSQAEADGERDDWDSDSEDDLQIVLNDIPQVPMNMETGGMMGKDDDDEDGGQLVLLADGDANQGIGEQEWTEGGKVADGEKKEGGEAGKIGDAGGGIVLAPKIGYSSHGYHPFHSQFKYVRPGAAPMPGATAGGSGGASGQVSPIMGAMAGRGRGDWRPSGMKAGLPMPKGFHPNFGAPGWGNNMAGRGFGGGLDFTLPSHKTIFDVDIDSFEEKPWKYPGIDLSDFFNFGLNEESWKDYCKQLEQRRLETTMQSKIRVYESGRTKQDYDPNLPPELAAATGQVVTAGASNTVNSDGGQNDMTKGAARMRPALLPTGRPIQVEGGSGERLPSIDTRPPRLRDSDAIIEIVCQDTLDDDSSTVNGVEDRAENDLPMEDVRGGLASEAEIAHKDTEYFNGFPDNSKNQKELVERTLNFVLNNVHENRALPFPVEASGPYSPGSRGQGPMDPSENSGSPHDERNRHRRARKKSPSMTPIHGKQDNVNDTDEEESVESMDDKFPLVRDPRELSVECKDDVDEELQSADGSPDTVKDEVISGTHKDESSLNPMKTGKIRSEVEQWKLQELDEDEDSRVARSSENSTARSGSSRDYQKWLDGAEDEVVQGEHSCIGIVKKHLHEHDQIFRRNDRDGRHDIERNRMAGKSGDDSYPLRDFDASLSHNMRVETEGFISRREERVKTLMEKRDCDNGMGSRNRAKVRESDWSHKDDCPPRRQSDNGSYKDVSARHRERDDNLKSRYEAANDYHSKRRKDEEYLKRDHADKEGIMHGPRESSSSRRKRERDEILDPRRRDEQLRIRDNFEEHQSARHKDEVWLHRERVERQRERDGWDRLKQSHDGSLSKREREEGRGNMRSGRRSEDKAWVGHTRGKDEYKVSEKEYQLKETVRRSELVKRRDWNDDDKSQRGHEDLYARGHQFSNNERKSRQERSNTQSDRAVNASDSLKGHEKKHKENTRKNRDSVPGNTITLSSSRKSQEDLSGHNNETGLKSDEKNQIRHNSSRKHSEDVSLKMFLWMTNSTPNWKVGLAILRRMTISTANGPGKSVELAENHYPPLSDNKYVNEPEIKDADTRPLEDQHLDTVEKLKKQSERFKLPMPREKDAPEIKTESETQPSVKNETPVDSEIKHERPACKRRWVSN